MGNFRKLFASSAAFPCLTVCILFCLLQGASAQTPTSGSQPVNTPGGSMGASPVTTVPPTTEGAASGTVSSVPAATATVAPAVDAKAAVQAILSMFEINQAVNVEATGKPLPTTGSWGAQAQVPGHLTKACALARVPCVNVFYRVPEAKLACIWTLGIVTVAEPASDGTVKHLTRQMVLDENDAAALFTLRKAWGQGETVPRPIKVLNPEYPKIARDAHIDGPVAVRLVIGPDGLVRSAVPIQGPAMLGAAVVDALRQWKFEPLSIGDQHTSFQLEERFNYEGGHSSISAGMDPNGGIVGILNDPHEGTGTHTVGAAGSSWESCSAASGCASVAPPAPK